MTLRRHSPKGRLLITGTALLLLLFIGVAVSGLIVNRTAAGMSERILSQIGEYHYHSLRLEFGKTGETLGIAARFTQENPTASDAEMRVLTATLLSADAKAERIWFAADGGSLYDFPRNGAPETRPASGFRTQLIGGARQDSVVSRIVHDRGQAVWCMACRVAAADGTTHFCGIDYPLPGLFTYMAALPLHKSYATVYNAEGIIVYHPDSLLIGHTAANAAALAALHEVTVTGHPVTARFTSDFLQVEEQHIYYPLEVGGQRWVADIGIPCLAIDQEIDDFHFYTLLTAVISVLFFAVLLVLAQRRWRREYELRRISEEKSEQLHLQQVLEQIDPHFLFNSLNSLYALIRCNPEQAREFTLTLSRVYRHVLERRHEILATVGDELEFTGQYYTLQKIRFGDCIRLTISVDAACHAWRIPSMSLQTLVENAVKHNHITAANPLRIHIYTDGDGLVIENNYTPRQNDDAESLGTGLERIRAVYRFQTSENITITTEGDTFRCRLPLLPPEK